MSVAKSPAIGLTGVSPVRLRLGRDERLARLAAGGKSEAFAAIYERYHQPLYRYCHSILGNREDAFDALQNTMARVLGALPGETREIALKPWLYRIAHNESMRLLGARRPEVSIELAPELAGPDPELQRVARERLSQLALDLRELSEQQRGALLMRDVSGLAHGEIAAVLGVSEAAAKQAVYEARMALHEFARGREMDCEAVTRSLSAGDGRVLRGRKLRGHLRDCRDCREFRAALGQRRTELGALAPPLAAPAAAALIEGLVGHGATAGGGGGLLGLLGGGAGKTLGTATLAKGVAAVVVAGSVGLGAAELKERGGSRDHSVPPPAAQENAGASGEADAGSRRTAAGERARRRGDRDARTGTGRLSPSTPRSRSGAGDAAPGSPSPAATPGSASPPGSPGIGRGRGQSGGDVPGALPVSPPGGPQTGQQQSQAPPGSQVPDGLPLPEWLPAPGSQVPEGPGSRGTQAAPVSPPVVR